MPSDFSGKIYILSTKVNGMPDNYSELSSIIRKNRLMEKQRGYYAFKIASTLAMLSISIFLLYYLENFWLLMANALFLGFVTVQIGLIFHDADHQQIFYGRKKNEAAGLISGNLLIGISSDTWT